MAEDSDYLEKIKQLLAQHTADNGAPVQFDMLGNIVRTDMPGSDVNDVVTDKARPQLLSPMKEEVPAEPQIYNDDYDPHADEDKERNLTEEPTPSSAEAKNPSEKEDDTSDEDSEEEVPKNTESNGKSTAENTKTTQPALPTQPPPDPLGSLLQARGNPTRDNLVAAQKHANDASRDAMIMRLGNQIGAGLGHWSPGVLDQLNQNADIMAKLGQQGKQDLQERIQMEKMDPNSQYSTALRDFAKKQFGYTIPEGVSAADLDKSFMSPLLKSFEADQSRQANSAKLQQQIQDRQDRLQDQIASREFIAGENQKNRKVQSDLNKDTKQSHEDALEMDKFTKAVNPQSASSRSPLGVAQTSANLGQRMLSLIDDPEVVKDSVFMNGLAKDTERMMTNASTVQGSKALGYNNLESVMSRAKSFLDSHPEGINTPEVIQQYKNIASDMIKASSKVVQNNFKTYKSSKSDLYKRRKDDIDAIEQNVMDPYNAVAEASKSSKSASTTQGVKMLAPDGTIRLVPSSKVQDAIAAGGKVAE